MREMLEIVSGGLLVVSGACGAAGDGDRVSETSAALDAARNRFGVAETFHTTGTIDLTNPMFLQLGTNARRCATCHASDMGWTLTAKGVARLFDDSEGLDPLFMVHDEGSRPDADISTEDARRSSRTRAATS
jgi:cytochrome c peroxidase